MLEANCGIPKKASGGGPIFVPSPTPGFKGEVPQDNFITFPNLTTHVGVTAGSIINQNEPWLCIVKTDGKAIYFPKKAIRKALSWEHLNGLGAVTGTKTVTIGTKTYKIRLFKGGNGVSYEAIAEWKEYIMGLTNGNYSTYTPTQLGTGIHTASNGELSICQENNTQMGGHTACAYRGINEAWSSAVNNTDPGSGWRPVLEEI